MSFPWAAAGWYCVFHTFVFYQQLHAKEFQGDSENFRFVLNISTLLGTLTGFVFLGYSAWVYHWWAPIALLAVMVATSIIGFFLERQIGALFLSMAGFVGWPITAWLMFRSLRHAVGL